MDLGRPIVRHDIRCPHVDDDAGVPHAVSSDTEPAAEAVPDPASPQPAATPPERAVATPGR